MRTEIYALSDGDKVQVTFFNNGVQACSLIPKGEKTPAPSIAKEVVEVSGDTISMSYKELRQEVIYGNVVRTKSGASIPCTQKAAKNPDKRVQVKVLTEGKKKLFQFV